MRRKVKSSVRKLILLRRTLFDELKFKKVKAGRVGGDENKDRQKKKRSIKALFRTCRKKSGRQVLT